MLTNRSEQDGTNENIRALREARNRAAPVFKLPPEIIVLVFKHVNTPRCLREMEVEWAELMQVAQVCRTWRLIALGCPSLWSRINFINTCVVEETLSRAKASQLIVRTDNTGVVNRLSPLLCSQLLDMEHLRELELFLPPRLLDRFLAFSSETHATNLRLLSLTYQPTSGSLGTACTLPAKVISLPMPYLQHLELSNCKIPWESVIGAYHELTFLKLCCIRNEPTRKQFFSLLSQIPKLEQLELISSLPTPSSDTIREVQLRRLSSCLLKWSPAADCLDFQAQVSYPVETANIIIIPSQSEQKLDAPSLKTLITSCGTSSPNPRQSHLLLWMAETHSPIIILSSERSKDFAGFPMPYSVAINLRGTENIVRDDHIASLLLDATSVAGLLCFSLCASGWAHRLQNVEQWSSFFNRHDQITEIYIDSASILSLLSALSASVAEDVTLNKDKDNHPGSHPNIPDILPLPNLVTLALRGHGNVKYLPEDTQYDTETRELLRYLTKRRRCGSPIQRLELWCCMGMDDELVGALRTEVVEVVWDGIFTRRVSLDDEDSEDNEDSEDSEESEDEYWC